MTTTITIIPHGGHRVMEEVVVTIILLGITS
jgi:hypothetical protein